MLSDLIINTGRGEIKKQNELSHHQEGRADWPNVEPHGGAGGSLFSVCKIAHRGKPSPQALSCIFIHCDCIGLCLSGVFSDLLFGRV